MEDNKLKEIKLIGGEQLEDIVNKLISLREEGKIDYYVVFNGTKLYSRDVTMDDAYKAIVGCSMEEYKKKLEDEITRIEEEYNLRKLDARKSFPSWVESGKQYIHPEKHSKWVDECKLLFDGIIDADFIKDVVDIMKLIDDGVSYKEIEKTIIRKGHTDSSYNMLIEMVLRYSTKGPKAYKNLYKGVLNKYEKKYLDKVSELNKWLDLDVKYDDAVASLKEYHEADLVIKSDDYNDIEYGSIIIKHDMTFEGIIVNSSTYICGKILKDNSLFFGTFSSDLYENHYFCKGNKGHVGMESKKASYPYLAYYPVKKVTVDFIPRKYDFRSEIKLEENIALVKKCLWSQIKTNIELFKDNIDIEKDNILELVNNEDSIQYKKKRS